MLQSELLARTKKEIPKEAEAISHKFLVRGDFIEQSFSGVYRFLPLGWRVSKKIEGIIRTNKNIPKITNILLLRPFIYTAPFPDITAGIVFNINQKS